MKALLNRFFREETGQDLIEYALLIAVITPFIVKVLGGIGSKVVVYYANLNAHLP